PDLFQIRDLLVQVGQRRFERLAVVRIAGILEIVQNAGPRKLQLLTFAVPFLLFWIALALLGLSHDAPGSLHLGFHILAFPAPCHILFAHTDAAPGSCSEGHPGKRPDSALAARRSGMPGRAGRLTLCSVASAPRARCSAKTPPKENSAARSAQRIR